MITLHFTTNVLIGGILLLLVNKSYGKVLGADNVSFSVVRGTVFWLLGANGAGKSTTIECMLGTKMADSGQISILGLNPRNDRKKLFEKVGVQFQESNYQEQITVGELCEVTASLYRKSADTLKLLTKFGINDILYFPMLIFSGATLPYEVMPSGLQKAADMLPLTQGIKLLKAASLGLQSGSVLVPILIMLVIAVICTGISLSGSKNWF